MKFPILSLLSSRREVKHTTHSTFRGYAFDQNKVFEGNEFKVQVEAQ